MSQSLSYAAWLRLRRRPSALIGLAVVVGFILMAVFAPYIAPKTLLPPVGAPFAKRPVRLIGLVPMRLVATFYHASFGARKRPSWRVSFRSVFHC
jgi:ABC-type dipeptide/oligopeptide/nickel transport system permease subunit